MMIIVEGIDRVGKTTLCNMLKERFDLPIFKEAVATLNEPHRIEDVNCGSMRSIINMATMVCPEEDFILDRFHWTEYIYGLLDRGYRSKYCMDLERVLEQIGAIIIWVQPVNISRSEEEHGKNLHKHNKMFSILYGSTPITRKFRCTYDTLEDACEFVGRMLG